MTVMLKEMNDIAAQIASGKLKEARQAIGAAKPTEDNQSDLDFLAAYVKEEEQDWEGAIAAYESVLEEDPVHRNTLFRLALLYDRYGEDERAIDLYERCVMHGQAPINALLNLALLYEEDGRLEESQRCLESVLERHPDNVRAKQFLKSVKSSYYMYYDERSQRDREARSQLMDTQISEFELSVRSRNCLKQMNIRTIGDLLRITEPELLSYKNFGETSLREIKAMLAQKGLRLGQAAHSGEAAAAGELPPESAESAVDSSLYSRSVAELELSVRSRKCLQRLGVTTLGDLCSRSEAELLAIKNFGQTSLDEIKLQLKENGLSLRNSG